MVGINIQMMIMITGVVMFSVVVVMMLVAVIVVVVGAMTMVIAEGRQCN